MKKETIVKTAAIIIVPGALPIFIGYKLYQFGKWAYNKKKEKREQQQTENNR